MKSISSVDPRVCLALATLPCLLVFSGCPTTTTTGDNVVNEIHQLTTEIKTSVNDVKKSQENLFQQQADLEDKSKRQLQIAADHVGGASYVNLKNSQPNQYTQLTAAELTAATAALGPPSPESQARIIEDLKLALSNSQADLEKLRLSQAAALQEARDAREAKDQALIKVGAAQAAVQEKTEALNTTTVKLSSAEEKVVLEAAAARDAEDAKRRAENAKARLHIAYGFMGLGGLLIVAAVVATALRVPGVLSAGLASGAVLLALGWLMSVLNEWLQYLWFKIAIGVSLLGALVFGVLFAVRAYQTRRKAGLDDKIGQGAIGALQEARNDDAKRGGNNFDLLKPYLKEWFVDDDGNPDTALEKEIKRRLVAMNLINPAGSVQHVVPAILAANAAKPAPAAATGPDTEPKPDQAEGKNPE